MTGPGCCLLGTEENILIKDERWAKQVFLLFVCQMNFVNLKITKQQKLNKYSTNVDIVDLQIICVETFIRKKFLILRRRKKNYKRLNFIILHFYIQPGSLHQGLSYLAVSRKGLKKVEGL